MSRNAIRCHTSNLEIDMTTKQNSRRSKAMAVAGLLFLLLAVDVLAFVFVKGHAHGGSRPTQAVLFLKHGRRHAHAAPWPRLITDWAISIGTRLAA